MRVQFLKRRLCLRPFASTSVAILLHPLHPRFAPRGTLPRRPPSCPLRPSPTWRLEPVQGIGKRLWTPRAVPLLLVALRWLWPRQSLHYLLIEGGFPRGVRGHRGFRRILDILGIVLVDSRFLSLLQNVRVHSSPRGRPRGRHVDPENPDAGRETGSHEIADEGVHCGEDSPLSAVSRSLQTQPPQPVPFCRLRWKAGEP